MSISYSTNFMGPVNMKWYSDRGLTRKVSKVLEEDQAFYPKGLGAGDVWEYEEITTHYACGRIDIRDDSKDGYDGWDEYSVSPMPAEDWNALGDYLWDLTTEELLSYNALIEQFEAHYGKRIQWATDHWVTCYNCWTINGHTEDCDKPLLEK
jgi:hypothetical protein